MQIRGEADSSEAGVQQIRGEADSSEAEAEQILLNKWRSRFF